MSEKEIPERVTNRSRKVPWSFLIIGGVAIALTALFVWPNASKVFAEDADIVVYKMPTCGCCGNWAEHLRDAGLEVNVVQVSSLQAIHAKMGVPDALGSCHTAVVGDYWVEGHVPADLVQGLMTKKPENIRGIAVPGMPTGSPGMEGPNPVKYEVLAYDKDGKTFVYATRQGRSGNDDE